MSQGEYTIEELMVVAMSKEVHDGEVVAVGVNSPIPAAACFLAELTHAATATLIILGHPNPTYYPFGGGSKELFDLTQRGRLDLFFVSGAQIDRAGNINLTVVGDHERPKLRLPGGMGTAMIYYHARRTVLFRTEHSRRALVEHVDFVTSPGQSSPSVFRRGGPTRLYTTLAVLRFDPARAEVALESVHPGATVEDVVANTGFALRIPDDVPTTPAPACTELQLLRSAVRDKLNPLYPQFVSRALGPAPVSH